MKNIKVGIIGTGFIADLHADALKRVSDISVAGCCDLDPGRAKSFASRWNIPSAYSNVNDLILKEKIDTAHILVPPDYHFPVTKEVLEKGVSVLLEKPMGLSSSECRELIRIAQENRVKLGVNHNLIFSPLFDRLLKDIASHRIGKPEYVIAFFGGPLGQLDFGKFGHWMFQKPGNIILEQGPHPISQIREILGDIDEIKAVATGKRELGKDQFFYDRWQAMAECRRGHAFIHLSFGSKYSPQRVLHVYGQDGVITADFMNNRYLVQEKSVFPDYLDPTANALRYFPPLVEGIKDFSDYVFSKLKLKDRADSFFLTMKNSITAFYDALKQGKDLPSDGEDGACVIESCEKWIRAADIAENPKPQPVVQIGEEKGEDILITGAGGFIGGSMVEQLSARGRRVRILVRNPKGLRPALCSPLVKIVRGDITDPESVRKAVRGVKYVFHLAHALGQSWEDYQRLNVEPAKLFAKACLEEKVKYFVFASTIAVYYYGDLPGEIPTVYGNSPIDSKPERRNFYARSKIVIENLLMQYHKEKGLPLIIARPAVVVGKNGILTHSGVGQWTRDNVCAYWGDGTHPLPFVLGEDVARALIHIIGREGLEGRSFNLAGDAALSAREYIACLKKYSQRNIRAFPYPIRLCFLSEIFKYAIKFAGGERGGLLSYRDLANRAINARFDCSEEKRLLDWKPCADKNEFLEKAIGWAF